MHATARTRPRTPSPPASETCDVGIVGSPFSDYVPDFSFLSPDPFMTPTSTGTSPAQRKLLSRLNRIGDQVLRRTLSDDASRAVDAELDAVEVTMQAPDVKSREPADIGDSGLFMDDDDEQNGDKDVHSGREGELQTLSTSRAGLKNGRDAEQEMLKARVPRSEGEAVTSTSLPGKIIMDEAEAHALVQRVTRVAQELRERHEEVKQTNNLTSNRLDAMTERLDAATEENLQLRAENEALRADLALDHSDLLFLKLKLKAVEIRLGDSPRAGCAGGEMHDSLQRWLADWKDADLRFQARRSRYGMAVPPLEFGFTAWREMDHTLGKTDRPRPATTAEELRGPKRIVAIKRSPGKRSFTKAPGMELPRLHTEPPTPSLTSASEESDEGGDHNVTRATKSRPSRDVVLDSDGITTTDEEDYGISDDGEMDPEEDEDDEGDLLTGEKMEALKSDSNPAKQPAKGRSTPSKAQKTAWEELWDDLTDFVGMTLADD